MDVGVVGLPCSGRTTVFRALLAHRAPTGSGGRGRAAAVGTIQVRDPRLERLAARCQRDRAVPIEIRLHDLCTALEGGFATAEVEGMKRMDLLLLVLPAFLDPSPAASVRELERLVSELVLEDLTAVERRLERAKKEKIPDLLNRALERAHAVLEAEQPVFMTELSTSEHDALRGDALVTDRPWIAVRNAGEQEAGLLPPTELVQRGAELGCPLLSLCAVLEAEMAELSPEEQPDFLAGYGVRESGGAAVTRAVLERADRIPFFTVGKDECRAWAIPRGTTAVHAAGKIHSDMERGFIRAEVIPFDDLDALPGGFTEARAAGKLRLEGKDYVVQDGDVVRFRFNV